ncbi:MAG: MoaD/ThiS family protein [Thermoplasmatales archaeon]
MPTVNVRYYANLRDVTKTREENISGVDKISDLINFLIERYGREFRDKLFIGNLPRENIIILVNGKNIIFLSKMETKLNEGDNVDIFPPVAGG